MSVIRRFSTVAATASALSVLGGATALLATQQLSATASRTATAPTESATTSPMAVSDPMIMALDNHKKKKKKEDRKRRRGTASHGPKHGSDLNHPSASRENPPGQTRDRIEQRNDDQAQRDAANNRHTLDGPNRSVGTQSGQGGPEPGSGGGGGGGAEQPQGSGDLQPGLSGSGPVLPPVAPIGGVPIPVVAPPPAGISAPPVQPPAATPPPSVARVADMSGTESVPAVTAGARDELPDSFRVGYPENLRSAGMPELVGTALPGLGGIVVFTAAGGLLGYRQAKAGHALLPAGARFLQ